jgi:hypothetical protein
MSSWQSEQGKMSSEKGGGGTKYLGAPEVPYLPYFWGGGLGKSLFVALLFEDRKDTANATATNVINLE